MGRGDRRLGTPAATAGRHAASADPPAGYLPASGHCHGVADGAAAPRGLPVRGTGGVVRLAGDHGAGAYRAGDGHWGRDRHRADAPEVLPSSRCDMRLIHPVLTALTYVVLRS